MYEPFYGFREKPFHVTADPTFLFASHHHREALDHLRYGIRQRLGFLLITGEVGTGKTTLAKALVEELKSPVKTALLLNPSLNQTELLQAIGRDFGLSLNGKILARGITRGEIFKRIERFLIQEAHRGSTAVLILDEAQALSTGALEQVRLISNVETSKTKLLQIVLVGQPELTKRLSSDRRLRALNERIAVRYEIQPISSEEVAAYITHRLRVAGSTRTPEFTPEAIETIARISQGVPRRINRLCDRALLAGFVGESWTINASMVEAPR